MTLVTFVEYWILFWACWPPGDAEVDILESATLEMEGEACLEFWYRAPFAAEGSELRALVKSSTRLVEIWSSPALPGDSWRQVFIPLNIIEPETRVKWHICNHKVANLTPFLLVNSWAFWGCPFHTKSQHHHLLFSDHSNTFPVFSWKHVASNWVYTMSTRISKWWLSVFHQVVFEAAQAVSMEQQIAFHRIGVRRGPCGNYSFLPLLQYKKKQPTFGSINKYKIKKITLYIQVYLRDGHKTNIFCH